MTKRQKYISADFVDDDLREFRKKRSPEIRAELLYKFRDANIPEAITNKIEAIARGATTNAIYFKYRGDRKARCYQNQLAIIHDFRRLLGTEPTQPQYIHTISNELSYNQIRYLLNEARHYEEQNSPSHFFLNYIGLKNHELTEEQTLQIIDFAREITEQLIQEITTMALEHMETFVPNEVRAYEARTEELLVTSTEPVSATI